MPSIAIDTNKRVGLVRVSPDDESQNWKPKPDLELEQWKDQYQAVDDEAIPWGCCLSV